MKRILVIGATGAQGGSVAHHLLQSRQFQVRCLTRHTDSDKAKALAQAGAELAAGDLYDKESLKKAMQDCDGVFGVTNYWEHYTKEYDQGINLIDAVVESGVSQFVLSTLPYISKITNGELPVSHFDTKGKLEEYARAKKPETTFVHLAFYYENFLGFIPLQKGEDDGYTFGFSLGDSPMAAVSVSDLGGILLPVFQHPEQYAGKTLAIAGDFITGDAYAGILSRISGKKINYQYIPHATAAAFDFPGAEELANMFEYYRLYLPYGEEAVKTSRQLYPSLKTFEQKMEEDKEAFKQLL
jgi:uncharacterized protein YbjT (DUF2867 family)